MPSDETRRSLGIDGQLALGVVLERLTGRQAPLRLGRYEVRRQLGAGGCGVVYAGWDPELCRDVAIKVLLPASDSSEHATVARARLLREAQALAQLRHGNVVEIFDVGVEARGRGRDRVYIVMELLHGQTLGEWAQGARPSWELALSHWHAVIDGVWAAHAAGIVHRDVKPANAMLTREGRVKVLDFGLARAQRVVTDPMERSEPSLDDSALTRSGTVMGTPRYMAPEQHDGQESTAAADQFALCACIFEALYGRKAYDAAELHDIAEQKRAGPPRRPRDAAVPPGIYAALARGMSPDPAARFPDLRALAQALHRGARRRRRLTIAVASAALAAAWGTAVLATEPEVTVTDRAAAAPERRLSAAEQELRDRIAAELEEHGHALSAERVDVTLAFVERALPTADALADTRLRIRLLELRGRTHGGAGHYAEAAAALTQAIWLAEGEGDHAWAADMVPSALHHLIEAGAPVEEIDQLERLGLDLATRPESPRAAAAELDVMRGLARIRRGDLDGAKVAFAAAESRGLDIPDGSGEVAVTRARLGLSGVHMLADEHAAAERYANAVLADPPSDPKVRSGALEEAHQRLGMLAFFGGDLDAAAEHIAATIASAESELGPQHPTLAQPISFYGEILFQRGEGDAGIASMERASALARQTVGWEHPMLGHILNNIALAQAARGNLEDALAAAREAREHGRIDRDAETREMIDADVLVASILLELRRFDEARPLVEHAIAHYGEEVSANLESAAGRLALGDGDPARAEKHLRRALEGLDPQSGLPADRGARGMVVWELAKARHAQGSGEEAAELAAHARTLLLSGNPWQQKRATELDGWVAALG